MSNLPLNEEKRAASNTLLAENLFELGKLFQQELQDYGEAINTYNESLKRFPDSTYDGEIYFNLAYCYGKLGMNDKAEQYKKMVKQNFAGGRADKMMNQSEAAKTGVKNPEATRRYESIYNLFIEGRFDEALAEKKKADSLYGTSFWTPQLLYIEAVYHVKQKDDSTAIIVLGNIVSLYPKSPLKPKAERMIDVLGRRKQIEEYLTNLQVTRIPDDSVIVVNNRKAMVRNDSTLIVSPKFKDSTAAAKAKADSAVNGAGYAPLVGGPYTLNLAAPHFVVMVFDKVDMTYINESKNALAKYAADNFRDAGISVAKDTVNKDNALLVFSLFANADEALNFLTKIQKAAPEEISWLPANKYSFLLIDNDNLQRMKNTKDIAGYRALLMKQYPGKIK
jgi:outer membrane protein assembly factor BamD (BamD/ComL family)